MSPKDAGGGRRYRHRTPVRGEYTLVGDDGRTIVSCVVFESKELYFQLANDPEQDNWYRERVARLLDGDPQWIDGTWA